MMPSRSADTLIQLIRSLQKGEKRNFKLFIQRNSSNEDLKILQLFDVLDKMTEYDEAAVLNKIKSIMKEQLANRKAHLYKQILASLRLLETTENIDLQLQEQLAYARDRMRRAGLEAQVEIRAEDYRDVQGQFDKVASIEMFEAVGEKYWPAYFAKIAAVLKPGIKVTVTAAKTAAGPMPAKRIFAK